MRIPAWSRRTWIAVAVCVLGVAVIAVAVLGGSDDSSGGRAGDSADLPSKAQTNLTPIPLETPDAKGSAALKKLLEGRRDPFASGVSYGVPANHKITVSITTQGYSVFGVRYRDKKGGDKRVVNGSYSVKRTVFGAYPIVQAGVQLSYAGGRATCRITIDGIVTSTAATDKPYGLAVCTA